MKCDCGYEGIPTRHHEHPHGWKCPGCHTHRPTPLAHDPVYESDSADFVCSQCGMRGPKADDLHTECPGHGANWTQPILHCVCGEWAFAPPPPAKTLTCRRCGVEYPEHLKEGYVPPTPPTRKTRGGIDIPDLTDDELRRLRALLAATAPKEG